MTWVGAVLLSGDLTHALTSEAGGLHIRAGGVVNLEDALTKYGVMDDADADASNCLSFLHSMLRLNPSDRATADELLRHKWLS
jgi:serine/threonine-protein kinase SRPK3